MKCLLPVFIKVINYQITGGARFLWDCYGPSARYLDGDYNGLSFSAIFDTETYVLYSMNITSTHEGKVASRWICPDYIDAYRDECIKRGFDFDVFIDDIKWHTIDDCETMLERIDNLLCGATVDRREKITIDVSIEDYEKIKASAEMLGSSIEEHTADIIRANV